MNKALLTTLLRRAGLMHAADRGRYRLLRYRNRQPNQAFRAANPAVALPPDYLMYESFQLNYRNTMKAAAKPLSGCATIWPATWNCAISTS